MTTPALPVADYMARVYENPPCWKLVADIYASHLGMSVSDYQEFKTISNGAREIARAFSLVLHKGAHGFEQLEEPLDYSLVLMGKSRPLGLHHCGMFYGGKVLHATPDGTYHQDLFTLRDTYPLMEFWAREGYLP